MTLLGCIIDAGEAEAIQLAIEQHADLLLIDDMPGGRNRVDVYRTFLASMSEEIADTIAAIQGVMAS